MKAWDEGGSDQRLRAMHKTKPSAVRFWRGAGVNAGVCTESMSARDVPLGLQGKAIFRMLLLIFLRKGSSAIGGFCPA